MLLYADDLVLMANSETELQTLLNTLQLWCVGNDMTVNQTKSKVIHFRPNTVPRTEFSFKCGELNLETVDKYTYLGLVLKEHLDYQTMAKHVAAAANRALGLLIAKHKAFGGFPFRTFSKLYDSTVWSTINYGAAIWGDRTFTCINSVQNKASRFFMGVGRYTPNSAVNGDTGWIPADIRQWRTVINQYYRLKNMDNIRVNHRIYKWADNISLNSRQCKNWNFRIRQQFNKNGLNDIYDNDTVSKNVMIERLQEQLLRKFKQDWFNDINRNTALRPGGGGNKLRTYRLFKRDFSCEQYLQNVIVPSHRKAYAQFRCGVAPIRLETGRFERLPLQQRTCEHCDNQSIETEEHVLLVCPLYEDLRNELFDIIESEHVNFRNWSNVDKLCIILGSHNSSIIINSAKICKLILDRRKRFLYR